MTLIKKLPRVKSISVVLAGRPRSEFLPAGRMSDGNSSKRRPSVPQTMSVRRQTWSEFSGSNRRSLRPARGPPSPVSVGGAQGARGPLQTGPQQVTPRRVYFGVRGAPAPVRGRHFLTEVGEATALPARTRPPTFPLHASVHVAPLEHVCFHSV